MDFNAYQEIIDGIKKEIIKNKNEGLWSIEEHWDGHQ